MKLDIYPADKLNIKLGSYVVYNKTEDFPSTKEVHFIQHNQYDHSWQDSTIYIFRAASTYTFENKVSVEARGYYWYWDMMLSTNNFYMGTYCDFPVKEERSGFDIIVKQPDNSLNLQWLIAYSRSYSKILQALIKTYLPDGTPYSFLTPSGMKSEETLPHEGMHRVIDSTYGQAKWGIIKNKLFLQLGGRLDNYSDYGNQITPRGGLIYLPDENS